MITIRWARPGRWGLLAAAAVATGMPSPAWAGRCDPPPRCGSWGWYSPGPAYYRPGPWYGRPRWYGGPRFSIGFSSGPVIVPGPTIVRYRSSAPGLAASTIADAQRSLQALGYNPGPADGAFGPNTQAAVTAFQRDNGLRVTGYLDDATLEALSEQAAAAPPPPPRQLPSSPPPSSNTPPPPASSPSSSPKNPTGVPVKNQPGYVTSPYAPDSGLVDVRGFPAGTQVRCPYTQKIFIVP